jgi:hypothetical protein
MRIAIISFSGLASFALCASIALGQHGHSHDEHAHGFEFRGTAHFDEWEHVDELCEKLENLSREICNDMHYNYRHNRDFDITYREAYDLWNDFQFVHDANHADDRKIIRQRIAGIDDELHHIQEDVRHWSRRHEVQIGHLGILTKLDLQEDLIHHLMTDIGVRPHHAGHPHVSSGGALGDPPPPRP